MLSHQLEGQAWIRRFENAVKPAKNSKGHDDPSILGLLVVTAQQVGD